MASVTAPDFAERFVGAATSTYGAIDIVVNNACYKSDSVIQKMDDEQRYGMIDVHLTGERDVLA